ncbi:MAG: enoyl-CoA hydratase-related protein [Bacteroidota bacterium]
MSFENILTSTENRIQTITINRPSKLNALNKDTIAELSAALTAAAADASVRAIILTGSGEKSFVAGADISEFSSFDPEQGKELAANGQKILFDLIEKLNKPVIAAINGFALGGGLELAMSCHFRLASSNAKLGLPEVTLGLIPGYGGTQRLSQLVGKGKAMEMILSAGMLSAEEALKWGLVNHVTEPADLLTKTTEIATKIAANSPMALNAAITAVNDGYKDGKNGFDTEIDQFGKLFGTADFNEGVGAFLEKRKPAF